MFFKSKFWYNEYVCTYNELTGKVCGNLTNFDEYQKMTESIKDNVLDENRKLKRQLSEKQQSFELVKSVHYDKSINLHVLNDIIVGCTGCLYSIIFYKNFEITNLEYSDPLFYEIMKHKKSFSTNTQDMIVSSDMIPNYTVIVYSIQSLQILEESKSHAERILLLFPNRFVNEEVLESVRSFMIITEVLINIVLTRERMIELIETDSLTGVLNRNSWNKHLESMKDVPGKQFILFLDVDNFKDINDSWGHDKGDEVLKFVGIWLKNSFRILDKTFRLGGDEFCVIGQIEDPYLKEFLKKIKRLNESFQNSAKIFLKMDLSISIGVLVIEKYPEDQNIYNIVDSLLYRSKREGRNRINVEFI